MSQMWKPGHWAAVCRSTVAAIDSYESDDSNIIASVLCAVNESRGTPSRGIYQHIGVGESEGQVKALIDPGSTDSFLKMSACQSLGLRMRRVSSTSRLANGERFHIAGVCDTVLSLQGRFYTVSFSVVDHLICDAIVGLDVLSQHSTVSLCLGGPKEAIAISHLAAAIDDGTGHFPMMDVEPPLIFNDEVYTAKPVVTKARWCKAQDRNFMQKEVYRMLQEGIIEQSTSCWRSQAFVVHGQKDRMVIDYSETVNRFTSLDAYPFPDMEALLNKAAEFHFFSKIDLKSAYHQIPIKDGDRKFTAFAVGGRLYQFTRLPFGLTNAVPAFQRKIDDFVDRNQLCCAFPFLDDVIIGGKTREEHDKNLKAFRVAAEKENLTLNLAKCAFGLRSVSMLGHVISAGTKRPDPSRFQTLAQFPYTR